MHPECAPQAPIDLDDYWKRSRGPIGEGFHTAKGTAVKLDPDPATMYSRMEALLSEN